MPEDSWRLSELRTFRQQQQKLEEEQQAQAVQPSTSSPGEAPSVGSAGKASASQEQASSTAATGPAAAAAQLSSSNKAIATGPVLGAAAHGSAATDAAARRMFRRARGRSVQIRPRPSLHAADADSTNAALQPCQRFFAIPTTVAALLPEPAVAAAAGAAAAVAVRQQPGGERQHFEENLWAAFGGFGRNGRCKASRSIAALQTPRPLRHQPRYGQQKQQAHSMEHDRKGTGTKQVASRAQ